MEPNPRGSPSRVFSRLRRSRFLSILDRFSETPLFRVSLESGFETAFLDTSESFLYRMRAARPENQQKYSVLRVGGSGSI